MRTKFAKTVENNNLFGVRQALADEMLIDPRGNSFKEMLAYAEEHLPDLYETDNGTPYAQDESEWSKDLLHNLKYDLSKNFSREKLTLFVKMAQYVLKDKAERLDQEEKEKLRTASGQDTLEHSAGQHKGVYAGVAIAGVAIAGVAVAVTGICISKMAVTTIGLAGVVIGGVLYLKNNRK